MIVTAQPGDMPNLSKAQKRDLLTAYRSPVGEAYGLCYGPMSALTQTHHLATEIFIPRLRGFHVRINRRGRAVAAAILEHHKEDR